MAHKPKLTEELIKEICKYISNGLGVKDCCDIVGISQQSFYRWQTEAETGFKEGKEELGAATNIKLKRLLSEEIKKAYSKYKLVHITRINEASKNEWQASAWMLERKFPDEFAKPDKFKIYGGKDSFEDLTPLAELLGGDDE
jgi:hypothetical protein